MKRFILVGIAIIVFSVVTPVVATERILLTADLEPGNEIPPAVSSPGTGVAGMLLDQDGNLVYSIMAAGLGTAPHAVVAAHIHRGGAERNGPVFKALQVDQTGNGSGTIQLTAVELAQFVTGAFYVNVHTTAFPGGALRGQITVNPVRAIRYTADLTGQAEVPPSSSDAEGGAFVYLNPDSNKLAYRVDARGFGPRNPVIAAHIHVGGATVAGPVVFPLNLDLSGNGTGIALITDSVKARLLANELYVNLHTEQFRGGAIRGQLEIDPGPSTQYTYHRNVLSGTQRISVGRGPSIIDAEALADADVFELVTAALAAGPPEVTVFSAFDADEFPNVPPQVIILTEPVSLSIEDEFFLQPGVISDTAHVSSGISPDDFRNFYFRDYTVSFNSIDVNQLAVIPSLFGPVVLGAPQLGGAPDPRSFWVTAYNTTFGIAATGDHLVGVRWKAYKTLPRATVEGDNRPAADVSVVIPVSVSGERPTVPLKRPSLKAPGRSLLETQTMIDRLIADALSGERVRP